MKISLYIFEEKYDTVYELGNIKIQHELICFDTDNIGCHASSEATCFVSTIGLSETFIENIKGMVEPIEYFNAAKIVTPNFYKRMKFKIDYED